MKIVFINPPRRDPVQSFRHPIGRVGLALLAAVAEQAGWAVEVIDGPAEGLRPDEVFSRVRTLAPQVVGIAAMTHEITVSGMLAERIKAALPGVLTLVGGPQVTALPERTLREFPGFDLGVVGEGEKTLVEVLNEVARARPEWSRVAGVVYRAGEDIRRTSARPWLTPQELDQLPFPAWHLFPPQHLPIIAGRGCPYRCSFCMRMNGNRMRLRSPERVIAEVDYLHKRFGMDGAGFQDEILGFDRSWLETFIALLADYRSRENVAWWWKGNSHLHAVRPDLLRRMAEHGCRELNFGIESGNQEILRRIHKNIVPAQAARVVRWARAAGIKTVGLYILGHPGETWRTAWDTIRFAARLNTDKIAVGVMVAYPGTEIWDMAKKGEHGYRLVSEDWEKYDKYFGGALELKGLSSKALMALQAFSYLWFFLRNRRFRDLYYFVREYTKPMFRLIGILFGSASSAPTPKA